MNGWLDSYQTKPSLVYSKTSKNPTERAKQGVKRRLSTGANLRLTVISDSANVLYIRLVLQTLDALDCNRPPQRAPRYPDNGYNGDG